MAQERANPSLAGILKGELELELDRVRAAYGQELDTTNGFDGVRRWRHQLSGSVDLAESFRLGTGVRLGITPRRDPSCCRVRLHLDGTVRLRPDDVRIGLRTRAQLTVLEGDERLALRQRAKLSVRMTRAVRPFMSAEARLELTPRAQWSGRTELGFSLRPNRALSLDLFYRFEIPEAPERLSHELGLAFTATVAP